MEHETVEYNPEIIRYLNWRYGGEQRSKRSTGLYQESITGISGHLQKAARPENQKRTAAGG